MESNQAKDKYWKVLNRNAIRMKCKHFNARAKRYFDGKLKEKTRYDTWGKCSNDCIRHLEILVRKTHQ